MTLKWSVCTSLLTSIAPSTHLYCIFILPKLVWAALLFLLLDREGAGEKGSKFRFVKHIWVRKGKHMFRLDKNCFCPLPTLSSHQYMSERIETLAVTALISSLYKRTTKVWELRSDLSRVPQAAWGRIRSQALVSWLLMSSLSIAPDVERTRRSLLNILGFWFSMTVLWLAAMMPQRLW